MDKYIMFSAPNYRLISSYINDKVNDRKDPTDADFDSPIAQSAKFDRRQLRGDNNQLRQELHNIINQTAYRDMDKEMQERKPSIIDEKIKWRDGRGQAYLNRCPIDGYMPDGYMNDGYGSDGYGSDGYIRDGYMNDGYGSDGYMPSRNANNANNTNDATRSSNNKKKESFEDGHYKSNMRIRRLLNEYDTVNGKLAKNSNDRELLHERDAIRRDIEIMATRCDSDDEDDFQQRPIERNYTREGFEAGQKEQCPLKTVVTIILFVVAIYVIYRWLNGKNILPLFNNNTVQSTTPMSQSGKEIIPKEKSLNIPDKSDNVVY